MTHLPLRLGYVSLHTSPVDEPGSGDAGGMNVVELNQALALGRRGHQVDLITRRTDPAAEAVREIGRNVRLVLLDAGPPEVMAKSAQEAVIEPFGAALGALEPYDVIVSQHWMSGIAALPVARSWGVAHCQSYHSIAARVGAELSEGEPPESPGREAGERLLAERSDAVIAISRAEARTVIERLGAVPSRVHIVPPGVDHEVFRRHHGEPRAGYLAYAARLQPLKAPDLAIRALAAVDEAVRPELHIAGDISKDFARYRSELDGLVSELGLDDQVRFVGSFDRPGLAAFFRRAALTLVPSYSETFGLVALESAACGTPVIASAGGGLLESVADGESGLVLPTRDPRAWGAAIEGLLTDVVSYDRLVDGAVRHAARFDWGRSAAEIEAVISPLVKERHE